MRVELVKTYDDNLVKQLVELEKEAFPMYMWTKNIEDYYRECLEETYYINVVMFNNDNRLTGYLCGIPQSAVYKELQQWDAEMKDDPDRIYVDTIQTLPGKRYIFGSLRLIHKMGECARKRGINKFSAHLRTINGFSKTILKTFPATRRIRQVDNWYGWGEPFDYVEGIITGDERGNRQH